VHNSIQKFTGGIAVADKSKYDGATIQVKNWFDYNPRSDVKKSYWFRLECDLLLGDKMFGMNCEHKIIWFTILSLICKKSGEPITWNSKYIEHTQGLSEATQDQAIDMFIEKFDLCVTRSDS
jgi:hypothetical protein